MDGHFIRNSGTPCFSNHLTTKEYVDNIKLYEEYIPNLEDNRSNTGFIARASSDYSNLYMLIMLLVIMHLVGYHLINQMIFGLV